MDAAREPRRSSRHHPYSAAVRASAIAALQEGLAAGRSLSSLAREMRLPETTAQRWLAHARGAFRPVTITPPPARVDGLVLQTVRGHRIEGLDLGGVIALLRALEAPA